MYVVAFLCAVLAVAAGETYRGNTQTRVFHQSSCRHYTCKNCTATFASPADAVDHGYRPCGVCRPGVSAGREEKIDAAFTGNTNSRKFHRASCRYAGCKNCTAKFQSRREAVEAGYAPGGCCDP